MSRYLGARISTRVGAQHALNNDYFDRIEALDYAIAHDDGQGGQDLTQADVILVGVSRTSKTPTCIYLAHRGVRAANVPLVPGRPPPPELFELKNTLIVGLITSPDRLIQIRRNRLLSLKENRESDYIDTDAVRQEIIAARRLFERMNWPIIDVTRRSVEETAAAIINLLSGGRGKVEVWDEPHPRHLGVQEQRPPDDPANAGVAFEAVSPGVDEDAAKAGLLAEGVTPREVADALAEMKAVKVSTKRPGLVIGADQTLDLKGKLIDKAELAGRGPRAPAGTARHDPQAALGRGRGPRWPADLAHRRERQAVGAPVQRRLARRYIERRGEALLWSVGCYELESEGVQLFDASTATISPSWACR
jgi:hypothetical protein